MMGLHVSDQRQHPIPCIAPPVPQAHLPKPLELLVLIQFLRPLALVDNVGIYVPNLSFKMYLMAGSGSMTGQHS